MRNNILAIASGLCFMAFTAQAQHSSNDLALAYGNPTEKNTVKTVTEVASPEVAGIVDYPTISYAETSAFTVEKEKALYRLSWQVSMREGLSYTEVQSSSDGKNFTTVGYVMNDNKNGNFDYFVPSDKNNTSSFRLVQHGLNAQKHTSEILRVK